MCSICSFDETKNKRCFYRGKDCIEKFCKDLNELGMEIINLITCKLKFNDSYRFMSTSLSNLADNLSGISDNQCKKYM